MGYGYYWRFPRAASRPKAVHGKERKRFGLTQWGRQWIEAVESEGTEQRMARGRAYARAEKVFGIDLKPGKVSAKVEGSLGTYRVNAKFNVFAASERAEIIDRMRNSPELGTFLNNELPTDLDGFCGVDVIPSEFDAECTCPDYENPCKHIAALYYTLADEIDHAPQILFFLRGFGKNELLERLAAPARKATRAVPQKPLLKKKAEERPRKRKGGARAGTHGRKSVARMRKAVAQGRGRTPKTGA